MKVRTGFVSNSSSSSFVWAGDTSKVTLEIEVSAEDILETKEDVENYLKDKYILPNDEEYQEEFDKLYNPIKEGKKIYTLYVHNNGDDIKTYLYDNAYDLIQALKKAKQTIIRDY